MQERKRSMKMFSRKSVKTIKNNAVNLNSRLQCSSRIKQPTKYNGTWYYARGQEKKDSEHVKK